MRPFLLVLAIQIIGQIGFGQDLLYFPPLQGEEWATLAPEELGWCDETVDDLVNFLDEKNSKSFIVLKDGKIVLEEYFDEFTPDSLWYWASAGKSLMATVIGMAQEDGLLDINDPTSDYLGQGWTSAPPEKENLITIWHQITMTTGLDETGDGLDNCLEPTCLDYLTDAGNRWFYYNSPYRLTQDVLEVATGQDKSVYTRQRLGNRIGMKGFWFNYVFYSDARDMARFGLLSLNQGNWNGDQVMSDTDYFQAMTSSSQDLNQSYGYLWWLNGQSSFKLPVLDIVFQGGLVPNAPTDMYAAMGKNEQRIYVVPSMDLVVVRQGDPAGEVFAGPSSFDNQLWEKLMNMACITNTEEANNSNLELDIFPNPSSGDIQITSSQAIQEVRVFNSHGQLVQQIRNDENNRQLALSLVAAGVYHLQVIGPEGIQSGRVISH